MTPERSSKINGRLIEEFYWAGSMVVYVDHHAVEDTFDAACAIVESGGELDWTSLKLQAGIRSRKDGWG